MSLESDRRLICGDAWRGAPARGDRAAMVGLVVARCLAIAALLAVAIITLV
jgi:hypothetical protein